MSRDPPSSAIITLVQGVGDILRDEDTTYGDADEDVNMMLNEQAAEDAMDSAIEHFDARVLNKTAGMSTATGFPCGATGQHPAALGGSPCGGGGGEDAH